MLGVRVIRPALVVLALLVALTGWTDRPHAAHAATIVVESESLAGEMLVRLNTERWTHGLPPLAGSTEARAAAVARSLDMATLDYLDHTSPSGIGPVELLAQYGIVFERMAENIAASDRPEHEVVAGVHASMLSSAPHRANMLNPDYSRAGVGVVFNGRAYYVTIIFLD